jgi:hypothetical protein
VRHASIETGLRGRATISTNREFRFGHPNFLERVKE